MSWSLALALRPRSSQWGGALIYIKYLNNILIFYHLSTFGWSLPRNINSLGFVFKLTISLTSLLSCLLLEPLSLQLRRLLNLILCPLFLLYFYYALLLFLLKLLLNLFFSFKSLLLIFSLFLLSLKLPYLLNFSRAIKYSLTLF